MAKRFRQNTLDVFLKKKPKLKDQEDGYENKEESNREEDRDQNKMEESNREEDRDQETEETEDIYLKRCKSRAAKIIKDSNHPGNHLFCLLPSGRRFRSMMAKTERLRKSFFPQAIRLLNTNSVS